MTLNITALVIYLIGLGYCIYLVDKLVNRAKEATEKLIAIWTILEQEEKKWFEDLREGRTDDFHKGRHAELSHLIDEFSKIEKQ